MDSETDLEQENTIEIEDNEHFEQLIESKTQNARKSLFNVTLNEAENKDENIEFTNCELQLTEEMKSWKALFYEAHQEMKKSKEQQLIVDTSILSPEKLAYLKEGPSLQNFVRDSIAFRQEANIFLKYTYAEMKDMTDNLSDICEHRLNLIKSNAIDENRLKIHQ